MVDAVNGLPPIMISNLKSELKYKDDKKEINTQSPDKVNLTSEKNEVNKDSSAPAEKSNNNNNVDYSKLADMIKETIGEESSDIQFTLDEESEKMIIRIVDNQTNEVVRQLPPELTLKIAKIVSEMMDTQGQVTNATV